MSDHCDSVPTVVEEETVVAPAEVEEAAPVEAAPVEEAAPALEEVAPSS